MGIGDISQTHGIVQTCLDVSGSMRGCTVHVADTDGQRLYAALEVRTNRCTEHSELEFICRLYADDGIDTEHVRTDI